MKFTFVDLEKLCVYKDGKIEKFDSEYVKRYKELQLREQKNKEWKKSSDAMLYEGYFEGTDRMQVVIHSLSPTWEENKLLYSVSVNESSGLYYKDTEDEKKTESHLLSSNEEQFLDVVVGKNGGIAGSVQRNFYNADIAVFSPENGDYKLYTGGDSKDEHPFFGGDGILYFNSYGVGRDANNEFVCYAPSEILKINTRSMEIENVLSNQEYSFVKPILDCEGTLYCIQKPGREKEGGNVLLDILLVPVRIVEAIVGFISLFVNIFTGKPLVGGKEKTRSGGGAAKRPDERKIVIHNHLLNVEKELKNNKKEQDGGFIPKNWKLIKIAKDKEDFSVQYDHGMAVELAHGVADYCLIEENGEKILVYTNGKRVFSIKENGEKSKLFSTDFCIQLGALQNTLEDCNERFH